MDSIQDRFSELTKDQQYVLSVLYKSYLNCANTGEIKINCNNFGKAREIHSSFFAKFHFEDVESDLKKLKKYGFLHGVIADSTINSVKIADPTISYFENEFKNNMKSLVGYISQVASFIPGL